MSEGFKGNQKNRNKKINPEERRIKHIKKQSRKEFKETTIAREHLEDLCGQKVEGHATLVVFNKKEPFAPSLLEDVYVDGEYIDHVWVTFPIKDRKKLKMCKQGTEVHFSAVVNEYFKRHDRELKKKYGLENINLIQELP
jgi:hypothetical protein